MKKFNESFYTNDFDQEMLNFIKDNLNVTADGNLSTENMYLKYGKNGKCFWTHDNAPMSQLCFVYLTKNQFKEKIGMTNESQPEKQEGIFKLIDKEGYSARSDANKEFLEDYGILVDGFYYYKGRVDAEGDLMEVNDDWCLIDNLSEEFEYFEEVDCIPLPKDKPKIEEVFVEQTDTFTKSMLVSGEHIIETREGIRYLVAGGMLINLNGYQPLGSYEDNLEFKNIPLMSIDKVYSGRDHTCEGCLTQDIKEYHAGEGFKDYINQDNLTLIWQRESPEQKEKRLQKEKLELKLQELQKECKLVEDEIMKLGD